jgi:GNAT superfamily N-acetyltransferase
MGGRKAMRATYLVRQAGVRVTVREGRRERELAPLPLPAAVIRASLAPMSDAGPAPEAHRIERIESGRGALCRRILEALPEWFGIPEAIEDYAEAASSLPVYAVRAGVDAVALISLREHLGTSLEIHVMGILPAHHRRGIGRALIGAAEAHARERGLQYLTVKTLGPSRPNAAYAATRAFYQAQGFVPLEELRDLWDAANPCLILIKPVW